jgi:hypothetical protein
MGETAVKIACITSPRAAGGRAGAALSALEAHWEGRAELWRFVPPGREREGECSLHELRPRSFDQLLYVLADESQPAFALRWLRRLGGTVWMLDHALPALAFAASPRLARGGWLGCWQAVRHGGLRQARAYRGLRPGADGRLWVPPELRGALPLQRSVTRFGDAFLLHSQAEAAALLADRNEPTPVAVVPGLADPARIGPEAARAALEALSGFPHARSARRALLVAALRASEEARSRRAAKQGEPG